MRNVYSVDFYQGWLIEIIQVEAGFGCTCYSPCWEKFGSSQTYISDFVAMNVARQYITQHRACYSIALVLRELYETDRLSFEEWRSLQQALAQAIKTSVYGY